eukprot:4614481-Karenia_brevis.AAC.1
MVGERWEQPEVLEDASVLLGPSNDSAVSNSVRCTADQSFVEISHSQIQGTQWKTSVHHLWKDSEPIHLSEARSGLFGLERFCRTRYGANSKKMFLGDNMSVTLAFDRCRAHDFRLLLQVRKMCGLLLSRNSKGFWKWIPSEFNPADFPSRQLDRGSAFRLPISSHEEISPAASKLFSSISSKPKA